MPNRSDGKHVAPAPGSSLRTLGRYRVVAELGRGSTSIVYLAAVNGPQGFNKLFALKQLRPALAEDPALVDMFLAEARVGAQLSHPNVVTTLEIDQTDALPFIVMEYLDGQPLQSLIAAARIAFLPLPLHMHLAALSGALEGLGYAHAALGADGAPLRIVHRDVSPHNVFVTSSGMPKLLDFGFAQTAESSNTMLSSAGRVAYMSPEQASGREVDSRSDLFAMGVMLWEAVVRRRFWSDEASKTGILHALTSGELPSTRLSALARAPEALRAIVAKATAPDASDRYESAAALQADLQAALRQITPPTFNLRDLGERLAAIFATDRAKLQAVIDAQRESARASGRGKGLTLPLQLDETSEPNSSPDAPVERRAAKATTEPALRVEATRPPPLASAATPEGPLPSFPMPVADRAGWHPTRREVALVAILLAGVLGVGLSAVHVGPEGRRQASASAEAIAPTPDTPVGSPRVEAPRASAPAEPAPTEPASADDTADPRSSAPAAPARTAEAAPIEVPRAGTGLTVARTRAASPAMPGPAWSVPPAPAPSKPTASGGEVPIHVTDSKTTPARPSRPIDSLNPYGQ